MAKAIFNKNFNFSSRKTNAGWSITASPKPQSFPQEVVDAAIDAGVAVLDEKLKTPKKTDA